MNIKEGLIPLIDADILRYEIGYAAETGWKEIANDPEAIPPFDYVRHLLHMRIENIKAILKTTAIPVFYLTSGVTFRYAIANKKPYKGTRLAKKPWHFNNLSVYFKDVLNAKEVTYIEADDALAMDHLASEGTTVLCSRDKDLKQIPGPFYSWELGAQPSYGPKEITIEGDLILSANHTKLSGSGLSFFYAQVLTGDTVDNIPGLPKCGPVAAFEMLNGKTPAEQLEAVCEAYKRVYGDMWEAELTEQGQLCWIVRRFTPEGMPQLWQIGMEM